MAEPYFDEAHASPPMLFRKITLDADRTVTIADDGVLFGGSKQRLLLPIVKAAPVGTQFVYAGAPQGAAQPALGYAIKHCPSRKFSGVVFITATNPPTPMTRRAASVGVEIREVRGNFKKVQEAAERYVAAKRNRVLLPFGLNSPEYIRILADALREAWSTSPPPKRIWMVAGSLTMYAAYSAIFPDAEYHLVQVGKTIWPDQLRPSTTLHVSPLKFWEPTTDLPPYPSVATYDAKLWHFRDLFRDDDVIINVAADELVPTSGGIPTELRLVIPDESAAVIYRNLRSPRDLLSIPSPPFPYKSYAMTPEEILARFLRLRHYEANIEVGAAPIFNIKTARANELLYAGRAQYIRVDPAAYWDHDLLSDAFTETARIQCRRNDGESPAAYWAKHAATIIRSCNPCTATSIRDKLAEACFECTTFKPSLLVGIAKLLCGPRPRILDISSGWGDRLIGAMALDAAAYYAADPNTALQPGYDAIRAAFGHLVTDPAAFVTLPVPFEELKLDAEYDLVFTSPPYWNLELYGEAANDTAAGSKQSTLTSTTGSTWYNQFLMPSLRRAFATLRVGGHMVININDARPGPGHVAYTINMIRDMQQVSGCNYIGCLPQWTGNPKKSAQPFWIFCKR